MDRDEIITRLREHKEDLQSLGVISLALFGSTARGQKIHNSDIDLAAIYDEHVVRDLIDMGGVAAAIEGLLGTDNFDLANEAKLRSHVRSGFQRDHVRIF